MLTVCFVFYARQGVLIIMFMNLTGMRCAYRTWHAIVSGAKIIFCIMRKNNIFAIEGVARLRGQKSKYVFKVGKFFV